MGVGEAKLKRQRKEERRVRLLLEHPWCCFCGGTTPAKTVDHVPARICFRRKEPPEGYEFSACEACNAAAKASEQVVAMYIRLLDHDGDNLDPEDIRRLVRGVGNNLPGTLPARVWEAGEVRRTLRERGVRLERGKFLEEVPVMTVPPVAQPHFDLFGRKLLYALHYRVTGKILTPDHRVIMSSDQRGSEVAEYLRARGLEWFEELVQTKRPNVQLGSQFVYRHGYNAEHGFFGVFAEFGKGFTFFGVSVPPYALASLPVDVVMPWRSITELGAGLAELD